MQHTHPAANPPVLVSCLAARSARNMEPAMLGARPNSWAQDLEHCCLRCKCVSILAYLSVFKSMLLSCWQVREVYERAIANIPPATEKRYWQRYIYLWINYALFEELEAEDPERYSRSSAPMRIVLCSALLCCLLVVEC